MAMSAAERVAEAKRLIQEISSRPSYREGTPEDDYSLALQDQLDRVYRGPDVTPEILQEMKKLGDPEAQGYIDLPARLAAEQAGNARRQAEREANARGSSGGLGGFLDSTLGAGLGGIGSIMSGVGDVGHQALQAGGAVANPLLQVGAAVADPIAQVAGGIGKEGSGLLNTVGEATFGGDIGRAGQNFTGGLNRVISGPAPKPPEQPVGTTPGAVAPSPVAPAPGLGSIGSGLTATEGQVGGTTQFNQAIQRDANGMPITPGYQSIRDASGNLLAPYAQKSTTLDQSKYNDLINQQMEQQLGSAAKQSMTQAQQGYNQAMMRGGAGGGSWERLAQNAGDQGLAAQQGVRSNAAEQMLRSGIDVDKFNAGQTSADSRANAAAAISDVGNLNNYGQNAFTNTLANQQGADMAAAYGRPSGAGGGGLGSVFSNILNLPGQVIGGLGNALGIKF